MQDDIVISSSPIFLLQPICSRPGIGCLIASEVDTKRNIHRQKLPQTGKVQRLKAEYAITHIGIFYSDSHSDLPLAKIANKAFLVIKGTVGEWKGLQSDH